MLYKPLFPDNQCANIIPLRSLSMILSQTPSPQKTKSLNVHVDNSRALKIPSYIFNRSKLKRIKHREVQGQMF